MLKSKFLIRRKLHPEKFSGTTNVDLHIEKKRPEICTLVDKWRGKIWTSGWMRFLCILCEKRILWHKAFPQTTKQKATAV
jgi:hypothetical protein